MAAAVDVITRTMWSRVSTRHGGRKPGIDCSAPLSLLAAIGRAQQMRSTPCTKQKIRGIRE
jgi:hypothetical protein